LDAAVAEGRALTVGQAFDQALADAPCLPRSPRVPHARASSREPGLHLERCLLAGPAGAQGSAVQGQSAADLEV